SVRKVGRHCAAAASSNSWRISSPPWLRHCDTASDQLDKVLRLERMSFCRLVISEVRVELLLTRASDSSPYAASLTLSGMTADWNSCWARATSGCPGM